jgi:choline-sulfatase
MYENSIRVPAIFSHPGRLPHGLAPEAMVSSYDFMPTLLGYMGLPCPEGRNLPGSSFLPVLRGDHDEGREDVVLFDEYGNTRMVRTRDWKLVRRHPDGPDELWDLANDPDERRNLIADPAQAGRIRELDERMEAWFARYVDPSMDGLEQEVNGLGQMRRVGRRGDDSPAYYRPGMPYS